MIWLEVINFVKLIRSMLLGGGGGGEGWTKSTSFNHFEQVNLVTLAIVIVMLGAKKNMVID
jgi:hypothetical protein